MAVPRRHPVLSEMHTRARLVQSSHNRGADVSFRILVVETVVPPAKPVSVQPLTGLVESRPEHPDRTSERWVSLYRTRHTSAPCWELWDYSKFVIHTCVPRHVIGSTHVKRIPELFHDPFLIHNCDVSASLFCTMEADARMEITPRRIDTRLAVLQ